MTLKLRRIATVCARRAIHADFVVRTERLILMGILALSNWRRPLRSMHDESSYLLVPPGRGNIGDRAMVLATCAKLQSGSITILAEEPQDWEDLVGSKVGDGDTVVAVIDVAKMFHRSGPSFVLGAVFLVRKWLPADSLHILGADMMDGGYGGRLASRRWTLAEAAATRGMRSVILGFSWSGAPSKMASRAAVAASRRGVRCMMRDPVSLSRAQSDGLANCESVMDVVFAHEFAAHEEARGRAERLIAEVRGQGAGPVVAVNISALLESRASLYSEYLAVINYLLRRKAAILFVPHVLEPTCNDLEAIQSFVAVSGLHQKVTVVQELLSPQEVFHVGRLCDVVVSGRMHFGVLALSGLTPALVFTSQGKVEGLMQIFGRPDWCFQPGPGVGERIVAQLEQLLDGSFVRSSLAPGVEVARRAGLKNFVSG